MLCVLLRGYYLHFCLVRWVLMSDLEVYTMQDYPNPTVRRTQGGKVPVILPSLQRWRRRPLEYDFQSRQVRILYMEVSLLQLRSLPSQFPPPTDRISSTL